MMDEIWRVLKPSGTVWINLGDTYSGSGAGHKDTGIANYSAENFRKQTTKIKNIPNEPNKIKLQTTSGVGIISNSGVLMLRKTSIVRKST